MKVALFAAVEKYHFQQSNHALHASAHSEVGLGLFHVAL